MFDVIYNGQVFARVPGPLVVGDEVEGKVIWQVDYYYKVAWAT